MEVTESNCGGGVWGGWCGTVTALSDGDNSRPGRSETKMGMAIAGFSVLPWKRRAYHGKKPTAKSTRCIDSGRIPLYDGPESASGCSHDLVVSRVVV
jgi:hypothetical protein